MRRRHVERGVGFGGLAASIIDAAIVKTEPYSVTGAVLAEVNLADIIGPERKECLGGGRGRSVEAAKRLKPLLHDGANNVRAEIHWLALAWSWAAWFRQSDLANQARSAKGFSRPKCARLSRVATICGLQINQFIGFPNAENYASLMAVRCRSERIVLVIAGAV